MGLVGVGDFADFGGEAWLPAATAAREVGLSLCGLVAVGDFALLG